MRFSDEYIFNEVKDFVKINSSKQEFGYNILDSLFSPIFMILKFDSKQLFKKKSLKENIVLKTIQLLFFFRSILNNYLISFPQKSIVFFPEEASHLRQQIPLYTSMLQHKMRPVFIVRRKELFLNLKEQGINSIIIPINPFLPESTQSKLCVKTILKNKFQIKFFTDKKIKAILLFIKKSTYLDQTFYFFKQKLNKKKCRAVIIGYDLNQACRVVNRASKSCLIPTFTIQHGNITGNNILMKEHISDHLLVFGESSKNALIGLGIKNTITVVGPPYLKSILENLGIEEQKLISQFKHNYTKKVLIAFSGKGHGTSEDHLKKQIEAIFILAKSNSEVCFIIKLHKKDRSTNYKILEQFDNTFIFEYNYFGTQINIFEWLNISDLLITGNSSVANEALLLKKPVISVDFNDEYKNVLFIDNGSTFHCKSLEDLTKYFYDFTIGFDHFREINHKTKSYINSYFMNVDNAVLNCERYISQHSLIE